MGKGVNMIRDIFVVAAGYFLAIVFAVLLEKLVKYIDRKYLRENEQNYDPDKNCTNYTNYTNDKSASTFTNCYLSSKLIDLEIELIGTNEKVSALEENYKQLVKEIENMKVGHLIPTEATVTESKKKSTKKE